MEAHFVQLHASETARDRNNMNFNFNVTITKHMFSFELTHTHPRLHIQACIRIYNGTDTLKKYELNT